MTKPWLINADVGEGADDARIMACLDCANICCGAHAGGWDTMRTTLALAGRHGVLPGAHPGYADRANFGRTSLALSPGELEESVGGQILALAQTAAEMALTLAYVKPHGAMNHDMLADGALFAAILRAVVAVDPALAVMVPTNPRACEQQRIAGEHGVTLWWEVFADRVYEADGLLRPRACPDAVHSTPERIIAQLEDIVQNGRIRAIDGRVLDVAMASTVCIHGDNAPSVAAIRRWAQTQG